MPLALAGVSIRLSLSWQSSGPFMMDVFLCKCMLSLSLLNDSYSYLSTLWHFHLEFLSLRPETGIEIKILKSLTMVEKSCLGLSFEHEDAEHQLQTSNPAFQ